VSRLAAPAAQGSRLSGRIRHFEPPLRPVPSGPDYTELQTDDGRRVFIHRDVLVDLAALERAEHPNETAGLLFGRVFTDGSNQCALVRHLVTPREGEVIGDRATVTITAEGTRQMSERAQRLHSCADAIGWAHTHPTFNAYFSGTDRAEQAVWTSPASVGLVISGLAGAQPRFEVYVGPESLSTRIVSPTRHSLPRAAMSAENGEATPRSATTASPSPPPPGRARERREAIAAAIASAAVLVAFLFALWSGGDDSPPAPRPALPRMLAATGEGVVHTVTVTAAGIEQWAGDFINRLPDLGPGSETETNGATK
jgi:proteasome lid subunit RPN8/RPN11